MSYQDEMEKEEQHLCDQVNAGEITQQEFDREMRDMRYAARWQAQEAAQEAYDREMDRW